ncbi:hypothetical protein ACFL35_02345 [Candidatus Riflebacteria bacterium]
MRARLAKKPGINLLEVMIATFIMALGFFPIMNFFSYRNIQTKRVRARTVGISHAKNSLEFFIDNTAMRSLQFNQTLPDYDGKNVDKNAVACTDVKSQIFSVMGANPNHGTFKKGLVGELENDRIKYWIKILANPMVDKSGSITPASELVFRSINWNREVLNWPYSQSSEYHVMKGKYSYLDLFSGKAKVKGFSKTRYWDGRRLSPKPNSQGQIVPMCKAMIRVRWKFRGFESKMEFETYKAALSN